jgi:hypothetical protein
MHCKAFGIVIPVVMAVAATTYAQPATAPDVAAPRTKTIHLDLTADDMWTFGLGGTGRSQVVVAVTDLNMTPGFTLTAEQKTRIVAARDQQKKAFAAWQKDNKERIDQVYQELMAACRNEDMQAIAQAMKAKAELDKTCPPAKDLNDNVMAVLTDDQKKAVEDAIAKHRQSHAEDRPMNKSR